MALVCSACGSRQIEIIGPKRLICKITYGDERGTVVYPVTPKIQLDYEKYRKKSILSIDDAGITGAYELAFDVQKVHKEDMPGGVMSTFEDWSETIMAVETEGEEIVPFVRAASANGSSISASPAGSLSTIS